jgi:hypothetical protein
MAKRKKDGAAVVVAEVIGRALGTVVGTAEALKAQHPHPIDEALTALDAGEVKLAEASAAVGKRSREIGTSLKAAATSTRKAIDRIQQIGTNARAATTKRTKTVVKQVQTAARTIAGKTQGAPRKIQSAGGNTTRSKATPRKTVVRAKAPARQTRKAAAKRPTRARR